MNGGVLGYCVEGREKKRKEKVRVVPRRDETREGVSCAMGRDDEWQKQNRKPLPGLVNRERAGGKNGENWVRRRGREICHQMGFGPDYLSGCTFSVAIAGLVVGPGLYLQVPRFPVVRCCGSCSAEGSSDSSLQGTGKTRVGDEDAQATLWQPRRPLKMLDWSTLAPDRALPIDRVMTMAMRTTSHLVKLLVAQTPWRLV
jgi:hypothetical protein